MNSAKEIKKAFTLVELIVVIVILAILATIAFLSFSSQSVSARDSVRLADLVNISKGLSLNFALSGKYPLPESYITLTASGNLVGYQGKAGDNIQNMIKLSDGGMDPLDTRSFYTYSINSKQTKFQLLGLLEDGSNSALGYIPMTSAADYSKRFPITKGDRIGILLNSGTLEPTENNLSTSFTGIDLINAASGTYITKLSSTETIKNTIISRYSEGLIGYWDMETMNGTLMKDLSNNGYDLTISGTVTSLGKVGNAKIFNGTTDVLIASSPIITGTGDFSISAWINIPEFKTVNYIAGNYNLGNSTGVEFYVYKYKISSWMGTGHTLGITQLPLNKWHFVTITRRDSKVTLYVDGVAHISGINTANIGNAKNFTIGNGTDYITEAFKGAIDEVRAYDRPLTESEISAIYSATQ